MIRNHYQETLAERSLVVHETGDGGEGWEFYWYEDPITNGLAKGHRFFAHVSSDGFVSMIGMWVALNEGQRLAQEQAMQFAKKRFTEVGLEEKEY
jgi:hypothetical protein